jgi:dTMP kinase
MLEILTELSLPTIARARKIGIDSRGVNQRGKLVVFEGVDGAGKRTQADLLMTALRARGTPCVGFGFPRYESTFGRLIARFLNGELGKLDAIDPHLSALLYASDRFEAKNELDTALAAGNVVVADRYVGSNLAHQSARVPESERTNFLDWLRRVEYEIFGLPSEDLVIYLRLAAAQAQERVARKAARKYTALTHDIQEGDPHHLDQAAAVYDGLANDLNWLIVECFPFGSSTPRPANEIHHEVLQGIDARLLSRLAAG